jgi:Family of unknown function (DUF6353)
MKYIPNAVSLKIARSMLIGQKHSPTILFVGGVVGVVAGTILACRATLKLEEILEKSHGQIELAKTLEDEDYSKEDSQRDVAIVYVKNVVTVAKLYAPAIIVGTVSIAALTGSHRILTNRNAALTAAYAALEKGFSEYRKRVVDKYGEDEDRELRYGTELVQVKNETTGKTKELMRVGPEGHSIYARFFDEACPSWDPNPEYNLFFLKSQQNYANDRLHAHGHIFLNEVYDKLGIERSRAGQSVGWIKNKGVGDSYVDFGIFDGTKPGSRDFVNGREGRILLDFNVTTILDKI